MSAYRSFPSGAWQVSDIVGGYLTTRTYYGYSRVEAVRKFRAEVGKEGSEMSRNACSWCGTEVDDEQQYESRICAECFADAQVSALEEIGVEEMRNNGSL
ncbi:MAG: hypothetical protein EBR81_13805 [Proteobacteria bacterium]|nr:hypothetical protein [Pseudomonadota bacterium]